MYKVIALSVSGKGKRIFSAGDLTSESDFPQGAIESLLKGGYIKLIETEKPKQLPPSKPVIELVKVITKPESKKRSTRKRSK